MMLTATIRDDVGEALGILVLKPKVFSTGRTGWHGQAKVEVEGRLYQCQAQAVLIMREAKDSEAIVKQSESMAR